MLRLDKLRMLLLWIIFGTSSFDIFLKIDIAGFSLRTCHACMALYVVLSLINNKNASRSIFVPFYLLVCMTVFAVTFVFNTNLLARNLMYLCWHGLHLIFCIAVSKECDKYYLNIVSAYKFSFVFVGAFSILQFILGVCGYDLLIQQWWFSGFPRASGFSYEPSYLASYLIIGWGLFLIAWKYSAPNQEKKSDLFGLIATTMGIILSSSRMGIGLILLFSLALWTVEMAKDLIAYKIRVWNVKVVGLVLIASILFLPNAIDKFEKYNVLFAGLGVAGGSSHSKDLRMQEQDDVIKIITNSPLTGVGFGGIPSAIAEMHGVENLSNEDAKHFEGMNVHLEMFAQLGIIGGCLYAVSMLYVLYVLFKLQKRSVEYSVLLRGLGAALVLELLILTFNQNIQRAYFWCHLSVIGFVVACAHRRGALGLEKGTLRMDSLAGKMP